MITIFGWMEIRATYLDEDLYNDIDENKIYQEVEKLVSDLRHNKLAFEQKNYTRYIQFNVFENHKTERTEEIISLFEKISKVANGSYGLLYCLDDEDKEHSDEFRVLVSKKGIVEWNKDEFLSPCSSMIEDLDL